MQAQLKTQQWLKWPDVDWAIFVSNIIRDFPSSEYTAPPAICYTGSSVTGADSNLVKGIIRWQKGPWDLGTGESFGAASWLLLADPEIWILKLGSRAGPSSASPLPVTPSSHFLCLDLNWLSSYRKKEIMPFGRWYCSPKGESFRKVSFQEPRNFRKERKKGTMIMCQC